MRKEDIIQVSREQAVQMMKYAFDSPSENDHIEYLRECGYIKKSALDVANEYFVDVIEKYDSVGTPNRMARKIPMDHVDMLKELFEIAIKEIKGELV